jgi:hypothetical protein
MNINKQGRNAPMKIAEAAVMKTRTIKPSTA